jgi:PncC family amidohydrolase
MTAQPEPASVQLPGELTAAARAVASRLIERGESVAVAESSAGGLISAALLSVPGASAYYLGGAVVYTAAARALLADLGTRVPPGMRGASEPWAQHLATSIAGRLGAAWGVSETGATGPAGNPYGDPPGHAWVAVAGPGGVSTQLVATGIADREANMVSFALAALELLQRSLAA